MSEKTTKKSGLIILICALVACATIAFIVLLFTVIMPNAKYNAAVELYNEGKYEEAITAFEALDGYKDSAEKIAEANKKIEIEKKKELKVGDTILFGNYEQDNDTSNGKEAIEWLVIAKEDDKLLVITDKALDCQQYNTSFADVTWETCTLRTWLNDTFLNAAFSTEEQSKILSTDVPADANPKYSTDPGNATTDKVFLLSITEVEEKYLSSKEKCVPTAYAVSQGASADSDYPTEDGENTCWWWLRSSGSVQNFAAYVTTRGWVYYYGQFVDQNCFGVRPAMWISLE